MRQTVCLLGSPCEKSLSMETLAAESGWTFEHAGDLRQLREIGAARDIVAVLIDAAMLGMRPEDAVQAVSDAAPKSLPILCHKASETIEWTELAQAGAFHALLMPLHPSEVRQTFGFISDAHRRRRVREIISRLPPRMTNNVPKAADNVA